MFEYKIHIQTRTGYIIFTEKAWNYQAASLSSMKRMQDAGWQRNEYFIYNPYN